MSSTHLYEQFDIRFPDTPIRVENGLSYYAVHSVIDMQVVVNAHGDHLYHQQARRGDAFRRAIVANMSAAELPTQQPHAVPYDARHCYAGRLLEPTENLAELLRAADIHSLAGIHDRRDVLIYRADTTNQPPLSPVPDVTIEDIQAILFANRQFEQDNS